MDANKQQRANEFEEFIYDHYIKARGISLAHYVSKKGQYERGENRQGYEIKNDQLFRNTNNLFISVKRVYNYSNNQVEHPSGIYRETETKQMFYVIGDKNNFWEIPTRQLIMYHEVNNPELKSGFKNNNGTDWGFLLPVKEANRICSDMYSNQIELVL